MSYKNFYLLSVAGVLAASFYPIWMGARVVSDMILNGTVRGEDYPKYIIPYTPISLALIVGVLLMPPALRYARRLALPVMSVVSAGVFLLAESLLESMVTVTTTVSATLESWQMFMCYKPLASKTITAVDILMGEYSPAFKIHFYLIAFVLILSLLNCFYGFAHLLKSGDKRRLHALVIQAVLSVVFLGLCILACFTAFFRNGDLQVSFVSAILMGVFFVVFGISLGVYVGSFLLGQKRWLAIWLPAAISAMITLLMYVGEMILLSGNLYRFGSGWFFDGLGSLVLAPVDYMIILLSGLISAGVLSFMSPD